MATPVSKLHDDVEALKAMVLAMAEKANALETEVADLKARVSAGRKLPKSAV